MRVKDDSFQAMIDAMCHAERDEQLKTSPQLILGELIAKLESKRPDDSVVFDFDNMHPTSLCSWRGSYDELAIEYSNKGELLTVDTFLTMLKSAVGATYEGYKGGEFVMGRQTPLWVDNYGVGDHRGVVGVKDDVQKVIIITAMCEF